MRWPARLKTRGRSAALPVMVSVVGVGVMIASFLAGGEARSWLSSTLGNIGVALFLFVPLYWMTHRLDTHVAESSVRTYRELENLDERLEEAGRKIDDSRDRFDRLEEDLERRLASFTEQFRSQMDDRTRGRELLMEQVRNAPSRDEFLKFVDTCERDGVFSLSELRPRVAVGRGGACLVLQYGRLEYGDAWLQFYVEEQRNGPSAGRVEWGADATNLIDIAGEIDQICAPFLTAYRFEDGTPDEWLRRFADLAEIGYRGRRLRSLVESFGDQWVVTNTGIQCVGREYDISKFRLRELDWISHLSKKAWVDIDSFEEAFEAASHFWPLVSAPSGEPPF